MPDKPDTTTYVIIAKPDSDFDKSLRWFLTEADRKPIHGKNYDRSHTGHAPESIWRLCRAVESFYTPEPSDIPEGMEG